jgi:hypothetical protein
MPSSPATQAPLPVPKPRKCRSFFLLAYLSSSSPSSWAHQRALFHAGSFVFSSGQNLPFSTNQHLVLMATIPWYCEIILTGIINKLGTMHLLIKFLLTILDTKTLIILLISISSNNSSQCIKLPNHLIFLDSLVISNTSSISILKSFFQQM